ncbi:uncharacterized protein Z518_04761 [Rhinocladiella mackenziei CBS 650.93]|uniref:AB hydrolase-1 domain-containing protein n=1 Tax=Rhinocladiella mackenziei CBS 650.93 TaxID=1442369 RepID=A0A0D2JCE9_9EURO|nr:uncharacterized protein Z518_04761 [Rhinocladiella mackenziei CBS 650.93]KIX06785.1 hypothetical protein Z518_04761 [Rhinocladiella mackenziei CBS 650.93]
MSTSRKPGFLYTGEKISVVNNAPTMTYFVRGDPAKPMIVVIPGAAHPARIFYGGHENSDPVDFIGHWFTRFGYSFLAISYPFESEPALLPADRPDFTVQEWGNQAAEVTMQIIKQENLPRRAILLMWSMAGKILQPYFQAAHNYAFDVDFAVSLVATPAIRGLRERPPGTTSSKTGYCIASPQIKQSFLLHLQEQSAINGGKCIIPDDTYVREYVANLPVGLTGWGYRWSEQDRQLIDDKNVAFEVADQTSMGDLPYLCSIYGDSPADLRHSIADKYTWGFMMMYQLMGTLTPAEKMFLIENPEKGKRVTRIIQGAPDRLSALVQGGHHFFIGEKGAKRTAELVVRFEKDLAHLKSELRAVFQ